MGAAPDVGGCYCSHRETGIRPTITTCLHQSKGLPIGDIAMENFENYDYVEADDDLPGVHLESTESAEIPGVGSTDQDPSDNVPDLADAFDIDVDFDSQANPQDIVQMDNDSPVPEVEIPLVELGVGDTLAGGTAEAPSVPIGVRRSHVSASK